MNIIFVTNEFDTAEKSFGGLATFTANIARLFYKNGHKVRILMVSTKEEPREFDEGIPIENVFLKKEDWEKLKQVAEIYNPDDSKKAGSNRGQMVYLFKAKITSERIKELNKEEKVDIVHFCNHGAFSLFMGDDIPYVTRISGLLNIIGGGADELNGSISFEDNTVSLTEKIDNLALTYSKYVISPSQVYAKILNDSMGINASVIESPFCMEEKGWDFSLYDEVLKNKQYVLFWGALRYMKGIEVIAKFVKPFLNNHRDMLFVFVGDDRPLKGTIYGEITGSEYIKKSAGEFEDRALYLGMQPRIRLYPLVKNATVCLLPSRIENLSNACIEAMALGKVVVATNGASYEQLIEDGISGFLCERDNPSSFYNTIDRVLKLSEEEMLAIGKKARERVERMSPDNAYRSFFEYYTNVIQKWNHLEDETK